MTSNEIEIQVVYALRLAQEITRLRMPAGTTVAQAVARAGVALRHPEVDLGDGRVAVYGRLVSGDAVLRDQDRVEILRPLSADPTEVRRRRAARRKP